MRCAPPLASAVAKLQYWRGTAASGIASGILGLAKGGLVARMSEKALNPLLAVELGAMMPGWGVTSESTRMLTDAGSAPDIVVETEIAPISVETEYAPAKTVEEDALSRIGKTVAATGHAIESAVALRLPTRLSGIPAVSMAAELRAAGDYQWCVWIEGPRSVRFPPRGWIEGSLTELAAFIEAVAVSERRIAALADAFEGGISQAAGSLRAHFERADGQATLDRIAAALHLHDSEQTSVMAVAIVANALVFQSAVSASLGTPTVEELRRPSGAIVVADILAVWRNILDINYWPIFAVASNVLKPVGEPAGQVLLDRLSRVVVDMSQGGVLAAGDLAGQMFGKLIADRKFLATFYTLPASATLLAELAVSRLDSSIDWSDTAAVGGLESGGLRLRHGDAALRRVSAHLIAGEKDRSHHRSGPDQADALGVHGEHSGRLRHHARGCAPHRQHPVGSAPLSPVRQHQHPPDALRLPRRQQGDARSGRLAGTAERRAGPGRCSAPVGCAPPEAATMPTTVM